MHIEGSIIKSRIFLKNKYFFLRFNERAVTRNNTVDEKTSFQHVVNETFVVSVYLNNVSDDNNFMKIIELNIAFFISKIFRVNGFNEHVRTFLKSAPR